MATAKKVLVIDDDASACGLIEEVLTRLGLEVLISLEPRAGYETAKANIPDLIFINLLLSGTNGLKVSKAIHAVKGLEKIPVIMLISYQGELDPKYTATIGIPDTLVKPLKEAEIIAKTRAILGDAAVTEPADETVREISLELQMGPMTLHEEEEMAEEAALTSARETHDEPIKEEHAEQKDRETMNKITKERESYMPEKGNPFNKNKDDDRNLFTDESDIFGEELNKSRAEAGGQLMQEKQTEDSFSENDGDLLFEEEKPANSLRRILLIVASIVAGIGLGVGGYLFFTAGSKHAPVEKQIVKTLPEPAPVQAPPVIPSEKPNVIPEIPVKSEPQKPETAQAREAKSQEPPPIPETKKERVQKAEAEKPKKEATPAAAVKSEGKKPLSSKQAAEKAPAVTKEERGYYVQAGFFANEANAKAMAEKLKKLGYAPSVIKVESKDKKVMFRVAVGTYADFKKAVEISETLNKQGIKALVHKQ